MTFFQKIFFGILFSTLALSSTLLWSAHHVLVGRVHDSYRERYEVLTRTLGRAITEMERNTEASMATAARVIEERELRTGSLSNAELRHLAPQLGASHLFEIDPAGTYVRATTRDPSLIANVTARGSDEAEVRETPILRPNPKSVPYKFLFRKRAFGRGVIEVGVKITFLDQIMRRAIEDDRNVVSLNLYTADGQSLSQSTRGETRSSMAASGTYRVAAGVESGGDEHYRLEAVISNQEVDASLARIQKTFIVLQVLATLFALGVARVLAGRLSYKLCRVAKHVQRLTLSGDRHDRLVVQGADEIDHLADEFNKLLDRVESAQVDRLESQKLRSFNELATQVAHDIRSPLAALVAFEKTQGQLPEERRLLLRSAVNRINDIANNLLLQVRAQDSDDTSARTLELVPATVSSLVTEKRMQYRSRFGVELNYEVLPSAYGLFSKLSSSELKRVLSNLIDNAFEAIADEGRIRVSVLGEGGRIKVQVRDSGAGIPAHVLAKLGARGNTGKARGCGLGVHHAFETIRGWGGDVRVETAPNVGTMVELSLVQSPAPAWFCSRISLDVAHIVVVDDDLSIHNIWRERFTAAGGLPDACTVTHLATTQELEGWLAAHEGVDAQFLIDYEFIGSDETGISFIERHDLGERSLLVTSRFEDQSVQEECLKLGLQIIPKSMALYVPFVAPPVAAAEPVDAILLDDDELVHGAWQLAARTSGKRLWAFRDAKAFLNALTRVAPSTPIYIDHQLGEGLSGLELVKRVLRRGYKRVHLATGDAGAFGALHGVAVVGKAPAIEIC